MDATAFEQIVKAALTPNNEVRKAAEQKFTQIRTNSPDSFFMHLFSLLMNSTDMSVRSFSAIMIRQYLSLTNPIWDQISSEIKEGIKNGLIDLLQKETNGPLRRKINDAFAKLAVKILRPSANAWPELMPFVIKLAGSDNIAHRSSAYKVVDHLAEYCVSVLRPSLDGVKNLLVTGVSDTNDAVRLAALNAVVSLLIAVEDEERLEMAAFIPFMFQHIEHAFKSNDDDNLTNSIESLVQLVRVEPTFLRSHLEAAVNAMVMIVQSQDLDESSRLIALEFLVSIAETGRGMTRKLANFGPSVIPLAFSFMVAIEHDQDAWDADKEDDSDLKLHEAGSDAAMRLADSLGGKIFMATANDLLSSLLSSSEWTQRHAAMVGIQKIADGCQKIMKPQCEGILQGIVQLLINDPHPRVQFAAASAIAQLSVDFSPLLQRKFGDIVIPALAEGMDTKRHPRVIEDAALSMVDFLAQAEVEYIGKHLDSVMTTILALLSYNNLKVQEAALSAVSSVAYISEEHFGQYYNAFMPGAKQILMNATGDDMRALRGKAMECIGHMGKAVGKDVFQEDAKFVMEQLISTQQNGLSADDPQFTYLLEALARICSALGDAFVPYLPYVIPPLLESAGKQGAMFFLDGDDTSKDDLYNEANGYETIPMEIRGIGNKKLILHTSMLEEKSVACKMLYRYATDLEDHYFDYVEKTAEVLFPLVSYRYNDLVRISAVSTMPALMKTIAKHSAKNNLGISLTKQFFDQLLPRFLEAMTMEKNYDHLVNILESFKESVDECKFALSATQMEQTNALLKELVEVGLERIAMIKTMRDEDADYDEEAEEGFAEAMEEVEEFLGQVHSLILALVKNGKETYAASFKTHLAPIILSMLTPKHLSGEQTAALCIIDDVIAHGGEPAKQYIDGFFPLCLQFCKSEDVSVRQSAAFGVGACAQALGSAFAPAVDQGLEALFTVINQPGARHEDVEHATDNAISAVGKIATVLIGIDPNHATLNTVLPAWLSWLPCSGDEEEAQVIHALLVKLLEANHPLIMGENNANFPKILSIFGTILETNCVDDETTQRIVKLWSSLRASLPPAALEQLKQGMTAEQFAKLAKIA